MNKKRNLKSWFKRHILTMWVILGLIYIIALPFLILTDVAVAVSFTISLILALMLASYLLRHYPKGRRVFE